MIYFHGNGEDLGMCLKFFKHLSSNLKVNIIAVEYPGYGVYEGCANENGILDDADRVIEFCLKCLNWPTSLITVFGRSIGSGPAIYVCSKTKFNSLILISPFTSLKQVVEENVGKIGKFVKEWF